MKPKEITCYVEPDKYTDYASKVFDYEFSGTSSFTPHEKPNLPREFGVGLIVGSSGSGKSILLREFGVEDTTEWNKDKSIMSHFKNPVDAKDRLLAVGLNTIPSWVKPYHVLSTGEKFRADMARKIKNNAVIDEYTSVVDRSVAKSASCSLGKYIKSKNITNVVLASCHRDIEDWIEADWVFDTDVGKLTRGSLRRPNITLDIWPTTYHRWDSFKKHHYLRSDINVSSRCFMGVWDGIEVAFCAALSLPSKIPPLYAGDTRNKYRESRLVVLPDYQGLGIGTRFSNAIGDIFIDRGYRYFSKVAHVVMGEYRERSDLWRPTSTNLKSREKSQSQSIKEKWHHMTLDTKRLCYSHEYLGVANIHRELWEKEKQTEAILRG